MNEKWRKYQHMMLWVGKIGCFISNNPCSGCDFSIALDTLRFLFQSPIVRTLSSHTTKVHQKRADLDTHTHAHTHETEMDVPSSLRIAVPARSNFVFTLSEMKFRSVHTMIYRLMLAWELTDHPSDQFKRIVHNCFLWCAIFQ